MKTKNLHFVLVFVFVLFVGCASRPTARPLLDPVPITITVAADENLVSDAIGHPAAILAAGEYHRVAEDKVGYYYANADKRVMIDGKSVKGGVGYEKSLGRYFIYQAFGEKDVRNTAHEMYGDVVASLAKSSTGDGVVRLFLFWILGDAPDHWITNAHLETNSPQPTQNAVH